MLPFSYQKMENLRFMQLLPIIPQMPMKWQLQPGHLNMINLQVLVRIPYQRYLLRCQPLKTARGQIGVLGIHPKKNDKLLTPEQRQTFDAFAHQAALAIERASLAEQARQAELLQATEKLQTALLNSISHDLRTPLVSITGALSSLREETLILNQEDRKSLLETAYGEAERLNRLVGNLLNMTRLEADAIHLRA